MPKVSAVVPVFNEEKTVAAVVKTLLSSPLVNEVVCVYDESSDRSLDILKRFGSQIRLIILKQRKGKGFALAEGIAAARGEIIAFFDADLLKLTEQHINDLITPLLKGRVQATLGYKTADRPVENLKDIRLPVFGDSLSYQVGHKFPYLISPDLSGERAFFKKDLLPCLDDMREARFGVEIIFNNRFKDVAKVALPGLRAPLKFEKFSFHEAIQRYIEETIDLAQEIGKQEQAKMQDAHLMKVIRGTQIKDDPAKAKDQLLALRGKIMQLKNKQVRTFLRRRLSRVIEAVKNSVRS